MPFLPWLRWVEFFAVLFALPVLTHTRGVTAVEKVIELLTKLDAQVTEEGAKEAAEYDKYACFCKEQADNKQYAIEKSADEIEVLTARILKLSTEISALDADVVTLGDRITVIESEVSAEEDARKQEFDAWVISNDNLTVAIQQVQLAMKTIQEAKGRMSEGTKLDLQQLAKVALVTVPTSGKQEKLLTSLLAAPGDPASYNFRSNDILSTLQFLQRTFKEEQKSLQEEESKAAAASAKKVLALSNEKKFKEQSKIEKEQLSAEKSAEKHGLEEDKTQEEKDKLADEQFRDELSEQCKTKAEEWDQRSQSRASELTAISEAIGILRAGVATTYGVNKKLVGLSAQNATVQRHHDSSLDSKRSVNKMLLTATRRAGSTFLQVRREEHSLRAMQSVLSVLTRTSEKLKSPALAVLRAKVEMQVDHFEKVRGLIKDLIAKLEADATSEADAKSYCDTEMTTATANRDTEASNMEEQEATIASKESEKVKLKKDISLLSKEIADLQKALNEATVLRQEEKADNDRTIQEAADGKVAVEQAISVLETYYGTFVQVSNSTADRDGNTVSDLAPEPSWTGEYKGNQGASKGIIGLLNVILSDFERTGTTVSGQESAAQSAYDTFKGATESSTSTKTGQVSSKEAEVTALDTEITTAKDALNTANGLHSSALKELEKLKAMCIEGEESYAERKKKREEEIEALREAMRILEEWKS